MLIRETLAEHFPSVESTYVLGKGVIDIVTCKCGPTQYLESYWAAHVAEVIAITGPVPGVHH